VALPSAVDRGDDRLEIAAIKPGPVGQIGRSEISRARGVVAMAGGAIGQEYLASGRDLFGVPGGRRGGIAQRQNIGRDIVDLWAFQYLIASERRHLGDPAVVMRRVDANAHSFGDRLRLAAPSVRSG